MAEKLTLSSIKNSGIPATLGLCSTDSRLVELLNLAHKEILQAGKYHGTFQEYEFCYNESECNLVFPRQVAGVEAYLLNRCPQPIFNQWYRHVGTYSGSVKDLNGMGCYQLIDAGWACTHSQMTDSTTLELRFSSDRASDAGKRVLFRGMDENGNWIRTLDTSQTPNVYIDGEYVTLTASTVNSTSKVRYIAEIQKDAMDGNLTISEFDTSTNLVTKVLGTYEPSERNPSYRKYYVPSLDTAPAFNASLNPGRKLITTVVKLEHIDLEVDTDTLAIQNQWALENMMRAIDLRRKNDLQGSRDFEARAIESLEREMNHYSGDGVNEPIVMNAEIYGTGGIPSLH